MEPGSLALMELLLYCSIMEKGGGGWMEFYAGKTNMRKMKFPEKMDKKVLSFFSGTKNRKQEISPEDQ